MTENATDRSAVESYVDYSRVGKWTPEFPFRIEADRLRAYAAATNDHNPRYLHDEIAPPLFAVVAIRDAVVTGHALAMSRGNPPPFQRLHGEHDIFFGQPMRPGTVVWSKAALIAVRIKPAGTALVFEEFTRDAEDQMVNRQYRLILMPGLVNGRNAGLEAPNFHLPDDANSGAPLYKVTYRTDRDQTYRYAPASGDWSRFHLDEEYAKSMGQSGVILPGLCTMAFVARAVVETCCSGDRERLKRLAVRFTRPVLPGQEITTEIWPVGAGHPQVFAFEARTSSGETVIRHGRAEVAT